MITFSFSSRYFISSMENRSFESSVVSASLKFQQLNVVSKVLFYLSVRRYLQWTVISAKSGLTNGLL